MEVNSGCDRRLVKKASVCCSISSPTIAIAREELASLWRGKAVELQLFADEAHRKLGEGRVHHTYFR